ncbi:unnamed protein product, partial [Mesorhabditis spiculigera]
MAWVLAPILPDPLGPVPAIPAGTRRSEPQRFILVRKPNSPALPIHLVDGTSSSRTAGSRKEGGTVARVETATVAERTSLKASAEKTLIGSRRDEATVELTIYQKTILNGSEAFLKSQMKPVVIIAKRPSPRGSALRGGVKLPVIPSISMLHDDLPFGTEFFKQ